MGRVSKLRRAGVLAELLARTRGVQHVHDPLSLQQHSRSAVVGKHMRIYTQYSDLLLCSESDPSEKG